MPQDWIDISVAVPAQGFVHWPGDPAFKRTLVQAIDRGDVANLSCIEGSAHTGTHMDAPRHFLADGRTIETMPLDATVGRARVIQIEDPQSIPMREVERHQISEGERILFRTANSPRVWQTNEFVKDHISIPPDTAEYLVSRRIRSVGVDYLSVGGPETHRTLLGAGIWVIEGLNLVDVEPGEYDLICLPVKLIGADGSPARAIIRRIG